MPASPSRSRVRTLLALIALASVIFTTISYEMLPVGLLEDIGVVLGATQQGTGALVAVYAAVVVVGAIPLTAWTARLKARGLLLVLLVVFVVSSTVMSLATNLTVAIVARLLGGVAHAVIFTTVFRLAIALVRFERRGAAVSALSGANAAALSIGVPAATAIGVAAGPGMPFAVLAGLFAVLAALVLLLLPSAVDKHDGSMSAREVFATITRAPMLRVGVTVMMVTTAHYVSYTYISSIVSRSEAPQQYVSVALIVFGVSGIAGLLLVARLSDRYPRRALRVALIVVAIALSAVVSLVEVSLPATMVAIAFWGFGFGAAPVLMQVVALRAAGGATTAAPPMVNTTFNIGISAGSVIGGTLITVDGPLINPWVSAGLILLALAVITTQRWLPADHPPSS